MSASLRVRVAEAAAVFDAAVEDANSAELVELVERAAWGLLSAAETARTQRHPVPAAVGGVL